MDEVTRSLAKRINGLEFRVSKIETMMPTCICDFYHKAKKDEQYIEGLPFHAAWFCPIHGRQEI